MPERPRRRKNKNKRKNKANQPDNSSERVNTVSNDDASSVQSADVETENISEKVKDVHDIVNECQSSPSKDDAGINKVENQQSNQDIKNNNDHNTVTSLIQQAELMLLKSQNYVVESPNQSTKNIPKLANNVKSKSLDNDDAPKIVEITEDSNSNCDETSLAIIDSSGLVSDVESDVEWEKTDDFQENEVTELTDLATGTLSIETIPLSIAQCDETKALTSEAEKSLREYLSTLNLSTQPDLNSIEIKTEIEHIINREIKHRLRKKGLTEDFLCPKLGPPRVLDVIDEESSESSIASRRHSHLSDKKSDNEDLEDDVFESKNNKVQERFATKSVNYSNRKPFGRQIPQECVLVGAKIKEPEVSEARGDWSVKTIEKMKGAELVYLTDSSSSTSSINECADETDEGAETDVSIRIVTPTIEVTDTEKLLKKSFECNAADKIKKHPTHPSEDRANENCEKSDTYIENVHEIVVLSTDNIKTNLYVKDIDGNGDNETRDNPDNKSECTVDKTNDKTTDITANNNKNYDLEMKVIKCELNDAINNLIKEVVSDSENNNESAKDNFIRQDSSSSVCSSQCTAKYNPNYSSLNDVSNLLHDETCETNKTCTENTFKNENTSHVKDVIECVTGSTSLSKTAVHVRQPLGLRDLCVRRIATLPYGEKILEELASVSEKLQNITILKGKQSSIELEANSKMPYFPLPDVSSIETVALETKSKAPVPPPIHPRNSSLKKAQDDHWTGIQTKNEPVYVCLSPSQKMLMEKTNTVITKEDASQLVDMHKKYVDRRGYNEYYNNSQKKIDDPKESPVIPFKSQTGSRLLALIRDPNVTNSINSSMNKQHCYRSVDHLEKTSRNEFTRKLNEQLNSIDEFSGCFKPIPPPRPRKYSSSFYESDESDFTDSSFRSMKNERKFFHYSTGNLNKEIEHDVSSIQNMHRFYTNFRDEVYSDSKQCPRRPSLPKDLCEQQMEYIRQKEKEVEAEIRRLEAKKDKVTSPERKCPRAPLISDKEIVEEKIQNKNNYFISRKRDFSYNSENPDNSAKSKLSSVFSSSQEEILRDKMYSEYVSQMAQRQERKQHKVIKITNYPVSGNSKSVSTSMPVLDDLDSKVNNRIEKEFICKARERWNKLGIKDPETEDERESAKDVYTEPKVIEHKIKVIEGGEEKDVKKLPSHLQDFVSFTAKDKEKPGDSAIWRPGAPTPPPAPTPSPSAPAGQSPGAPPPPPPPPPVWQPSSAGPSPQAPRKNFRPVHFEDTTPPARRKFGSAEQNGCTSGSESEQGILRTSFSAPASGLNSLGGSSRLPRAQNPTVTLLQKAREGQIPRGSSYLQQDRDVIRLPRDRPAPPRGDPVYALRKEYASEGEAERSDYERGARKMDAHGKVEGIGPTTKDGMPVALRSEVKDPSRWYKKMYDTIHKNKYDGQQPLRVTNKSQYAYFDPRSGYLSEPEGGAGRVSSAWSDACDSDVTGPRRRTASVQEHRREDTSPYMPSNKYSTLASARASQEVYKNQPGRIENYMPGKSSVVDKEAKQWWDEVMDIFDGQNVSSTGSLPQASPKEKKDITSAILSKSNMARALKESGYESDSTLVFRRREDTEAPLSPAERRAAYRDLQAGGEPPLRGFRSPAPPRQETDSAPPPPQRNSHGSYSDTESPRRYVESDVNIHYRVPVRHDPLPLVPERELARQQAEHMKRLYREQRRNKYLQELQDMQNRRHQDNFTPSQKNILPLNRYDEADKVMARALYAFNGQTNRELSFRKGDLINVRKQIDANWYEGELHGRIGLFPYNYVEILKGDVSQSPRKPSTVEGRARAKFDFTAQTNLELPLKKGELVVLTRRIDHNWWEGRNGNKTGIFPDNYVTILQEPSQSKPEPLSIQSADKPVASPAAHGLLNGSAKRSMGAHSYLPQPNSQALSNAPPATQPLPGYVARPAQATLTPSSRGYGPPTAPGVDLNNTEPLYVDTNAEAVPYRAMYKYRPQNPDELELNEGDTVYVLEQCDDGWYVGSSQRTGRFGTFPGNYVERI